MINVLRYLLLFFFYSAAGWLVESIYCSLGEKRIINRGFLTGPMCPIYGTGALVMTLFLYKPFFDRPLLVFLLGIVLCDIVEYITSFLMEILFHARWWDYTYELLNIKGRICLKHSLYWGVASVCFVYMIQPHVDRLLSQLNDNVIIYASSAILVIFAMDCIHSFIKALDFRNLQIKLSKATDYLSNSFSNSLSSVKSSIEKSLEKSNGRIQNAKDYGLEQVQEVIEQFELRFTKHGKKSDKTKYSSRYFRNNFEIEKSARKQIEKLKNLRDSIKADLFENEEKQ